MRRASDIGADVAICFAFFTRLPVPFPKAARTLSQAIWAAPVAGAAIALIGWLAYGATTWLGLPAGPAAALALTATTLATGALHEDGLADTADGFGGGRTAERKLEIMRDSRIGSYGALALGLSLLIRWSVIAALFGPAGVLAAFVAAHAASRALLPLYMRATRPARSDGLAAASGTPSREAVAVALALGVIALLPLGLVPAVTAVVALALLASLHRRLSIVQIGGHTGDTVGALQQAAEIVVMVVAAIFRI